MFSFNVMTSLIIIFSFFLSLFLMFLIWRKYRTVIEGTNYFLIYFALMITGALLTVMNNRLPDIAGIVLANEIIFVAKMMLLF